MKKIYQYRYYGSDNPTKNCPDGIAYNNLVSGSIFTKRLPILQLGIQSLPGIKFYLNNSIEPIIIGSTGVYELDLNNEATITSIRFDSESINNIDKLDTTNGFLIVDIIYDDGEEE